GRVHPDEKGGGDDAEEHRVQAQELEEVASDLRDRWCDRLPDRVSPVLRSQWGRRRRLVLRIGTCSVSDSRRERGPWSGVTNAVALSPSRESRAMREFSEASVMIWRSSRNASG